MGHKKFFCKNCSLEKWCERRDQAPSFTFEMRLVTLGDILRENVSKVAPLFRNLGGKSFHWKVQKKVLLKQNLYPLDTQPLVTCFYSLSITQLICKNAYPVSWRYLFSFENYFLNPPSVGEEWRVMLKTTKINLWRDSIAVEVTEWPILLNTLWKSTWCSWENFWSFIPIFWELSGQNDKKFTRS